MAPRKRSRKSAPAAANGCALNTDDAKQNPQQEKQEQLVRAALGRGDRSELERLAFSEHGFCSPGLRRSVWSFLLGLTPADLEDGSWRKTLDGLLDDGSTSRVIEADVQRSVYSWDVHTNINEKTRDQKRLQLSEVMHAVLWKHSQRLAYFQGFHDIVLVFMEVGRPSHAYHMVDRLALFELSDQLCHPIDEGLLPLLGVLYHLICMLDPALAACLRQAECTELHFAVPWVLTWFSHSLPRLHGQVMRLFDCLLCAHPVAILYFCASLLIQHRDMLLNTPREMPDMTAAIQGLSWSSVDVDVWARHTEALMLQVTPTWLLWRLRRDIEKLPATTPLLHYPHPWMRGPLRDAEQPGRCRELWHLAPVYLPKRRLSGVGLLRALREVPGMLWYTGSKHAMRALRLGFKGSVVVAAVAVLSRLPVIGDLLASSRQATKHATPSPSPSST